MCEVFDGSWKLVLAGLLFFSIFALLLRVRYSSVAGAGRTAGPPQWLAALVFWGAGFVGIMMLALMILGFVCAGSPGEIKGIIPN